MNKPYDIRTAYISSGVGYEHPAQEVVDRLHDDDNIRYFYLTNCRYATNHIPASNGENQLLAVGNKSRVSGDNSHGAVIDAAHPDNDNLQAGRIRGNIVLRINQAQSESAIGNAQRRYAVTYHDYEAADEAAGEEENYQVITSYLPF